MRKVIVAAMVITLIISLAACGESNNGNHALNNVVGGAQKINQDYGQAATAAKEGTNILQSLIEN